MSGVNWNVRKVATVIAVLALVAAMPVWADETDDRIKALEQEIAELRVLLAGAKDAEGAEARLDEVDRRIAILAEELEKLKIGEAAVSADEPMFGLGPAASKIYRKERGVSIGGYGEMLYRNFDSSREDGTPSEKTDEFDFLRAVLYFGYKFNDSFLFNSEIEFEHSSTGESGSASVEFAYLDYLWKDEINVRAGLVLLPMGFINELHEPTVFLGATRPETERRIIPSTWRENGVGIYGDLGPFTYRTYIVNGLDASGFSDSGIRGGRQKGSKAKAEDFAWTARFDYVGTPGLTLGVSGYFGDSGQGIQDPMGQTLGVGTQILEGHAEWRWRGLRLRALGAWADLDDVAALNVTLSLTGDDSIGEEMAGQYFEVGYDLLPNEKSSLIPYVRWETIDTQDSVPDGFTRNPANDDEILTYGLAYQPIDQIIIKVDYQSHSNAANTGIDQFNASLGYIF